MFVGDWTKDRNVVSEDEITSAGGADGRGGDRKSRKSGRTGAHGRRRVAGQTCI